MKLPKKAKVTKGEWKEMGYAGVWCEIESIQNMQYSELSLIHPKYGGFAWVDVNDCKLK